MLRKKDEGAEVRPPWEEPEASFDDLSRGLADGTISRSRAIKLAGAALVGSVLAVFSPLASEADADELVEIEGHRRRRRKRRERRERRQRRIRQRRIRRFRARCTNRGRVVCKAGNTIACCPPAAPGVDACANVLNNPLCVRLDLSSL
jgi:hypothetical protein